MVCSGRKRCGVVIGGAGTRRLGATNVESQCNPTPRNTPSRLFRSFRRIKGAFHLSVSLSRDSCYTVEENRFVPAAGAALSESHTKTAVTLHCATTSARLL